ncbi:MAG: D-hexose-6-phosphate mutarotase [Roseimicrobium sp.]
MPTLLHSCLTASMEAHEAAPDYPVIDIRHAAARAHVALHGAHLMEWTPSGHAPVLYLSPQAMLQKGKAIRGGVPICWPWFGPSEQAAALPAHGFVRNRFWELAEASENNEGVQLRLVMGDDEDTRRLWPHAFRLELEMRLGAELHLALKMTNTGAAPCTLTAALHTYLAVGDIRHVAVEGIDGAEYLDQVGAPCVRRQVGDVHFDGEVDREYATSEPVRIVDASLNRVLSVASEGSGCTVVWNPWIDKAARLADLPDADYQRFVCVETANAWKDRVTLEPASSHILATTVRVENVGQNDR